MGNDQERFDRFSGADLARITGGRWLGWDESVAPAISAHGVSDNSREISSGMLFVAIRGELADGHAYIGQAVEKWAAAVMAEHEPDVEVVARMQDRGVPLLLVKDSLVALQELARFHRRRYPELITIGITGSCGKTSTKEMVAAVLEEAYPGAVLKTEGNTNNHFGVPRNLLRLGPQHRAAVLELGTNHPGEIAALARLVEPTHGIICNIGHAHLEHLKDLAGVAREKGALFAALPAAGVAIYPANTPHVEILRDLAGPRRRLTYGPGNDADVQILYHGTTADGFGLRIRWNQASAPIVAEFSWSLGGAHQALNAGAAAALALVLGIPNSQVVRGLCRCRLPGMRMELREQQGVLWANDAYNSNPDSARASLQWFREVTITSPADKRLIILGDMRELGAAAALAHRDLLLFATALFPQSLIWGVGADMCRAIADHQLAGVVPFSDAAAARAKLEAILEPGLRILLKGSRGVGLERLLPPALRPAH